MSIVTRKGDTGETWLLSGERVSKSDIQLEAVGTLDELVAALGLSRSMAPSEELAKQIRVLQLGLMKIGSLLSGWGLKELSNELLIDTTTIEGAISALEANIKLPASFLVPGTTPCSSAIELARTIARRLERQSIAIQEKKGYRNDQLRIYLNRLSDYLFLLARRAEVVAGAAFDASS